MKTLTANSRLTWWCTPVARWIGYHLDSTSAHAVSTSGSRYLPYNTTLLQYSLSYVYVTYGTDQYASIDVSIITLVLYDQTEEINNIIHDVYKYQHNLNFWKRAELLLDYLILTYFHMLFIIFAVNIAFNKYFTVLNIVSQISQFCIAAVVSTHLQFISEYFTDAHVLSVHRWFPFDEQKCKMKFGSWTYDGSKINLTLLNDGIDMSTYQESGEWKIVGERHLPATRRVNSIPTYH